MSRRILLVMNPGSRGGRSSKTFASIESYLTDKCIVFDKVVTRSLDHAEKLAAEGSRDGFDTVVAIGGDGTINRVLNGLYCPEGRRISGTKMGVIHTGTSPDFCKSYGIPTDIKKACEVICTGTARNVSIGMVRFDNRVLSDRSVGFFACCANIGIGAKLAAAANSGIRKMVGDGLGTFLSLIGVLGTYRPVSVTVKVDQESYTVKKLYNMSIGKTFYVASGIKIAHSLTNNDTRLYALTVRDLKLHTLPHCLLSLYCGKPFPENGIFHFNYGNSFSLMSSGGRVAVEFDGDPVGFLPCTISSAPDPLPLICGGV